MKKKVFFVTAEKSGNDIAFPIIERIHRDCIIKGVGDNRFFELDCVDVVENSDSLSVMGYWEVLKRYSQIKETFNGIIEEIEAFKPDLIILFDAPSLNFRIAREIRKRITTKIMGVVSPTFWAMKKKRIQTVGELYDMMACILPFEKQHYDAAHVPAEYVGHPLIKNFTIDNSSSEHEVIGILPGSRRQEIEKHIEAFKHVIVYFINRGFKGKFLISKMPHISSDAFKLLKHFDNVEIEETSSKRVMERSSFLFVKSGTVTLETLLSGKPFLIFYKTSFLTYIIFKLFVSKRIHSVGLPNIIAGKQVIPEFLQHWDAEVIWDTYEKFCKSDEYEKLRSVVMERIGKKDYREECCKLIDKLLED